MNEPIKKEKELQATYEANGKPIKLTDTIIRKYLTRSTSGNGKKAVATDQDIMMFLGLCKHQKLDPFINEAYLVKMSDDSPATIITSKDVFIKRAARNPAYNGKEAGIVVCNSDNATEKREGAILKKGEQLIGGWCSVYRKDQDHPITIAVDFNEYAKKFGDKLMANWAKMPATMIRKVAVAQALREAFPDDCAGMYVSEEMNETNANTINGAKVAEKKDAAKEFLEAE